MQCFTGMEDMVSLLEAVLSKSCKTHKITQTKFVKLAAYAVLKFY